VLHFFAKALINFCPTHGSSFGGSDADFWESLIPADAFMPLVFNTLEMQVTLSLAGMFNSQVPCYRSHAAA
jgi:hypothetical protein